MIPTNQPIEINGKLMALCQDCHKYVRLDKPFIGSLHVCVTDEEAAQNRDRQRE